MKKKDSRFRHLDSFCTTSKRGTLRTLFRLFAQSVPQHFICQNMFGTSRTYERNTPILCYLIDDGSTRVLFTEQYVFVILWRGFALETIYICHITQFAVIVFIREKSYIQHSFVRYNTNLLTPVCWYPFMSGQENDLC